MTSVGVTFDQSINPLSYSPHKLGFLCY